MIKIQLASNSLGSPTRMKIDAAHKLRTMRIELNIRICSSYIVDEFLHVHMSPTDELLYRLST